MSVLESGLKIAWTKNEQLDTHPQFTWMERSLAPNQSIVHPLSTSSDYQNEQPAVDWPLRKERSDFDSLGRMWRFKDWTNIEGSSE